MMLFLIFAVFLICLALLFALAWTDHKYYILPNVLNLALLISFLILHNLTGWWIISIEQAILGGLIGGAFLLAVRFVANHVMGQEDTVGLGDVKFMIAAGVGVGVPDVLLVLSVGALFGIAHGFILREIESRKVEGKVSLMTVNVPAGVGLCLATLIVTMVNFNVWWEFIK